jgi:type II secretory pathway pseudopilin PulG
MSGLSLVEVLVTIGVLAVVSTISVMAISNLNRNTQHRKLETDVRTLNSAIAMYLANGGSLGGITEANAVLRKLKSTRSKADKELHVGAPSGRLVDPRVAAVAVPNDSWKLRASYNAGTNRFDVISAGNGVEFILDEKLAEVAATVETRSHGAVQYATNSGWVWDHSATNNPSAPQGPSAIQTNPNVSDKPPVDPTPDPEPDPGPGPGPGPDPGPPPPPPLPQLPTPAFSISGGAHPETDFPLEVAITNLPSSSQGDPIYQVGSGPWTPYTGPVEVPMNSWLRAQFLTKDPATYQNSSQHSAYYYPVPESLSGTVDGNFHSPAGGPNLAYQITNSEDRFAHGDPVFILDGEPINSGDPNVLSFTSQAFSNVAPGQKFKLGAVYYHNGSTYYDSHATGVALRIIINLPEREQTIAFDLNLDLVNTENDPDDSDASADYVRITNLSQNIPLQINGVSYRMQLEFGATDSFGFSSQSQFHVYEGATGQGELLGTFLPR